MFVQVDNWTTGNGNKGVNCQLNCFYNFQNVNMTTVCKENAEKGEYSFSFLYILLI